MRQITGKRKIKDVVIYIKEIPDRHFPPPQEPSVVDQKNLTFIPHILPVLKGTTVDFLNSDSVAHNVFSPDEIAEKMDLGSWQRGQVRSWTFRRLGSIALLCSLHPEMSAYVIVLQNPYFAKAEKDGKFVIDNVPAGDYMLVAWHESRKAQSKGVSVLDNEKTKVNFFLD